MRPAGEVRTALLQAARDMVTLQALPPERGITLADMAVRACVGREAARRTVSDMRRAGALRIVAQRRVAYRNRPVAEYRPSESASPVVDQPWVDLSTCLSVWAR
jgi:hypothetical protein